MFKYHFRKLKKCKRCHFNWSAET